MGIDPDGNIHVVPDDDLMGHEESERCWCRPDWDLKNKKEYLRGQAQFKVYIHNRLKDTPH